MAITEEACAFQQFKKEYLHLQRNDKNRIAMPTFMKRAHQMPLAEIEVQILDDRNE